MEYSLRICLFFACFFTASKCQFYVGDICTMSSTRQQGYCQVLSSCPRALSDLKNKRIFPQNCGFTGQEPIVCCVDEQKQTPPPTTETIATTTTTTKRPQPQTSSPLVVNSPSGSRKPGDLSREKCREYSKYAKVKSRPPILLINVEETETLECGHDVVELIVGGEKAHSREFPHQAVLGYESSNNILWLCGGSLITPQHVLTAGHCLISREFGPTKHVRIGTIDLNDKRHGQQLKVVERIAHTKYKSSSHYNDIGIVKMEKEAKMGPSARPACLYASNELKTKKAIATGFGKTQFAGKSSDELLKVTIEYFSTKQCYDLYKNQINRRLTNGIVGDSQICAGSLEEEKDTCQGDSGGPLQIYHTASASQEEQCMYDIVGITSFGKACSGSPGVYTRVSNYIEWIESVVWS